MAYAFNDDKSKTEVIQSNSIIVLEYTHHLVNRQEATFFTADVSHYISDIDDYVVIGAQTYNVRVESSFPYNQDDCNKWLTRHATKVKVYINSEEVMKDISVTPVVKLFSEDGVAKVSYSIDNTANGNVAGADIKIKIVLFKYK